MLHMGLHSLICVIPLLHLVLKVSLTSRRVCQNSLVRQNIVQSIQSAPLLHDLHRPAMTNYTKHLFTLKMLEYKH